jgi:hypothetical protein
MIDLGTGWAEFFFEQKIWDVTLSEATLHRRKESLGRKEI